MPVVSNTSPLLNLSIIGHLDLVRTQFDRVLIPPAVLDELHIDSSRPGAGKLKNAIGEGWVACSPACALHGDDDSHPAYPADPGVLRAAA